MDDKLVMTNLLDNSKSICNLLNQALIEANDDAICNTYKKVLSTFLTIQHDLYKKMQFCKVKKGASNADKDQ